MPIPDLAPAAGGRPPLPDVGGTSAGKAQIASAIGDIPDPTDEDGATFAGMAQAIAAYRETGDPISAALTGFINAKAAKEGFVRGNRKEREAAEAAAADKAYDRRWKEEDRAYQREQDEALLDLRTREDSRSAQRDARDAKKADYELLKTSIDIEAAIKKAEAGRLSPEDYDRLATAQLEELKALDEMSVDLDDGEIAARRAEIMQRYDEITGRDRFIKAEQAKGDAAEAEMPEEPGLGASILEAIGLGGGENDIPDPNAPTPRPAAERPGEPAAAAPANISGDGSLENPIDNIPTELPAAKEVIANLPSGSHYVWKGQIYVRK